MIHPTAIVEPGAELGEGVEIGPYAIVGPHVRLGDRCVLRSHAIVSGHTSIGEDSQVYPFASVGEAPQDLKYHGEPTRLSIGARNIIREYVTIHPGTSVGGGLTTVGDDNMIMISVHVGHDCHVGSHVVLTNNVMLAGHVVIEDYAYLAGASAVQQFVRVGESVMVSGMSGLTQDAAPFTVVHGYPAKVVRMNRINVERRGFSPERIDAIERAFRIVFRERLRAEQAFSRVRAELPESADAEKMVAFLEKAERGFARLR